MLPWEHSDISEFLFATTQLSTNFSLYSLCLALTSHIWDKASSMLCWVPLLNTLSTKCSTIHWTMVFPYAACFALMNPGSLSSSCKFNTHACTVPVHTPSNIRDDSFHRFLLPWLPPSKALLHLDPYSGTSNTYQVWVRGKLWSQFLKWNLFFNWRKLWL